MTFKMRLLGAAAALLALAGVALAQSSFPLVSAVTGGMIVKNEVSPTYSYMTIDLIGTYLRNVVLNQFGSATGAPAHLGTAQTTAPALTSCGTGTPTITGTDTAGIVTLGTSATSCTITFNRAYAAAPYCVVQWIATPLASQSYVTAAGTITLTQTSTSSNVVQYFCIAQAGG